MMEVVDQIQARRPHVGEGRSTPAQFLSYIRVLVLPGGLCEPSWSWLYCTLWPSDAPLVGRKVEEGNLSGPCQYLHLFSDILCGYHFCSQRLIRTLTAVVHTGLMACMSCIHRYFRMDSSATQFHIETHENTSGLWSMWYLNHFDRGVVLNDVFVSKETKRVLKVHMVFLSKFSLF